MSIHDIRAILFDIKMAPLYLQKQITYKLRTSQSTRTQKRLPYPLLVIEERLKYPPVYVYI